MKVITKISGQYACLILIQFAVSTAATAFENKFEYGGYFRRAVLQDSSDQNRAPACYGLSGPGMKYRLGNECDVYGELVLKNTISSDGISVKGQITPAYYRPDVGATQLNEDIRLAEAYVSGSGFGFAPESSLWYGKRFYARADVHIVDTKFTQQDGYGMGIEGVKTGIGKLSVAFFSNSLLAAGNPAADRLNVELSDIAVNPNGKLRVIGTWTRGKETLGTSGSGLTLQHNQANFLGWGGENTAWIQWANGSSALNGGFGGLTNTSNVKSVRGIESFTWQVGKFGGQAMVLRQIDTAAAGTKTVSNSLGARLSYALMENFKLLTEWGSSNKTPDGQQTQKVTKFTIAPTWSMKQNFWDRPEVRLYFTRATWNSAADAASGANGLTGNPPSGRTEGNSAGVQIEHWF